MESPSLSLMLFVVFSSQVTLIAAQEVFPCVQCIDSRGNYTSTSVYRDNLNKLLSIISTNTQIDNGFYKFSVGESPNKVYGIAVCRGDISVSDCKNCLNQATKRLPEECPTQKEAIGYYFGNCRVRYTDRPIFGIKELSPNCTRKNGYQIPASDVEKFKHKLSILFDGLRNNASAGDSRYKFATGYENVTAFLPVYGLMQCNPDLSHSDCSDCLQAGIRQLESCCSTASGAGVYGPSCGVEFENYQFVNMPSSSQSPIPSSSDSQPPDRTRSKPGKRWKTNKTWIIIVVVLFVLLIPLAALGLCFSRRRKNKIQKEAENNVQITCVEFLQFDFITIQEATDNFSDDNKLGKGGFSTTVYKGMLPNSEQEIAVKRLYKNSSYGELEFNNEVLLLADLQHRNLVKLLGFCVEKESRLLIYEYLPNESLDWFLKDPVKRANLNWETRHKIIQGIARGLLYLHEDSQLSVIHRDLKPSNILLDVMMNPKISNFSKASIVQADQTRGDSSSILGSYGYMPPEYVERGHFSVKSDVFSFGILLLEIISGKLICTFSIGEKGESLPSFAWRKWFECKALDVVDHSLLRLQRETTQILRCVKIALLCVQENPTCRPTMSKVVFMLNSNLVSITEPSRPAFVIFSDIDIPSSCSSSQKNKSYEASVNEASNSQLDPR